MAVPGRGKRRDADGVKTASGQEERRNGLQIVPRPGAHEAGGRN